MRRSTDEYISEYAATVIREDFAETFMLFMKHNGEPSARYRANCAIEKMRHVVGAIVERYKIGILNVMEIY